MNYFISPPTESNWRLAPSEFIADLLSRWPQALVQGLTNSPYFSHEWEIQTPSGILEGEFYKDGTAVAFMGDFQDCTNFVLWFRSLVPPEQPLVFYDDGLHFKVDITRETTAADIVSLVGED